MLHELAQRALSVGKRVHSETGIDAAGASVVSVALDMAEHRLGGLPGETAVLVGAGAMGALAAAHLTRAGIEHVHVLNRSLPRAQRLARKIRESASQADAMSLDRLAAAAGRCRRHGQLHRRGEPGGLAGRRAYALAARGDGRPDRW